ncbi:MAG: P-loop NTPase [Candidatus Aminicenantes bacterium]|nr:P-loop NTPase [Candidatus Aminicenantes bacterium]
MSLKIAVSSGKGGTGKTFVSTNLATVLMKRGKTVFYLDCDVEEPNGHLFLKPLMDKEEDVTIMSPVDVDEDRCTLCGACADACHYNAIAVVKDKVLIFKELCHVCGACQVVCPTDAVIEKERKIGVLRHGKSGPISYHDALLETAEGGMSPRLVKKVKENIGEGINILDSSPGTACPVVETIKETDLCILVTDPTPFGINDLKLAVDMSREIGQEPVILVNRAEYRNDHLKEYLRKEQLDVVGEIPDDREVAEIYSRGDLVVEKLPHYKELFEKIAARILEASQQKKAVKKKKSEEIGKKIVAKETDERSGTSPGKRPKELVVISGKGGTGKTSVVASFAALAKMTVLADCDVDAADLFLILDPQIKERGVFSGSVVAEIDQDKCTACGKCKEECRFLAIREESSPEGLIYVIDPLACEGCGVCYLVCRDSAVKIEDAVNGEWFLSETRFGPMSHAKLGIAEENSGRLVTLVRNNQDRLAQKAKLDRSIIDGSPGTGCPVIASLTGAKYALAVTEPTVSGVHDLERILKLTGHFRIQTGIVVNKHDLNAQMTEKIKILAEEYNAEFVGTIPYDKSITEAQMEGLSVVEYTSSSTTEAIAKIWNRVKETYEP